MSGEVIEMGSKSGDKRSINSNSELKDSNKDQQGNGSQEQEITLEPQLSSKVEDVNSTNDIHDDSDELDLSCGIGRFRTNIFGTKFSNIYAFSICFGISNLFAQMVSQVIQVQLTSLQVQFNIDNKSAGLFETASRIGFISTLLFAGHFAKKYHIPMIVGVAGVVQGLILTVPAIMQFVDPYTLPDLPPPQTEDNSSAYQNTKDSYKYVCGTTGGNATIDEQTRDVKRTQFYVVLAVQAIKGLTDTFHNGFLPVLYMDDNLLDKSKMGIVLGIWQVITELSGPIGKQINGFLTKVPIDLGDNKIGSNDPRFVSAWWLAFFVFGLGTAVFAIPLMLFPRSLVTKRQKQDALKKAIVTFSGGEIHDEVEEEITGIDQQDHGSEHRVTFVEDSEDVAESSKKDYSLPRLPSKSSFKKSSIKSDSGIQRLSQRRRSNLFPPVIGPTERKVSITGDLVFDQPIKRQNSQKEESLKELLSDFPKALVRVLKKPVIVLCLVDIAIVSIPFSGTSIFRNTYMANEYNVEMSEVALVSGITTAVGLIGGTFVSSWLSSRVTTKMGYALIIAGTWFVTIILIPFYFVFGCSNDVVYGAEGEFGRAVNLTDCNCTLSHQLISCGVDSNNYISPCYAGCHGVDGKLYTDCQLVNSTFGSTVTPGLCSNDCHTNFIIYAALHGVMFFFFAMAMIPRRLLILRIVDPQDRGFATSLFSFCFVLIGIPAPNLFGGIIDNTCLIWDDNVCTLYDRDKIRNLMSGIDLSVHTCVQITFLLMIVIFKCEEMKVKRAEKKLKEAASETTSNHAETSTNEIQE